ncbi:MAG: hypothetical protein NC311_01385 [Muribaculaceae bacterium]|nr:hypothetical protein [Muribaculaceae bacterium]
MDKTDFENQYREYADQRAIENGDFYNTSAFERHLARSPVFEPIDQLKEYELRLLNRALGELKTRPEWQDAEADDIRPRAYGARRQISAMELLERYQAKIQASYRAEQWYLTRLSECDTKIAELGSWHTTAKSKDRRLKHWRERRVLFDVKYATQVKKTDRYERLIYKWMGICEMIHQADIAREIAVERNGQGNKYGFNPNMQSRATATGIFED